ncbi:hypothetical protein [Nocardia sp. XZ_19_369]|uniref:hypothetical protein n=1 Tax=Nocardia sp. XZ_19_369 TaxID=2769487 RepID=UPI00188DC8EC|nr:hypothetical protein [Nocardia sp. XZ_19_369]
MSCAYTYDAQLHFPPATGDYNPLRHAAQLLADNNLLDRSDLDSDELALVTAIETALAKAISDSEHDDGENDGDDEFSGLDGEDEDDYFVDPHPVGAWLTAQGDGGFDLHITTEPLWSQPEVFGLLAQTGCYGVIVSQGDAEPGAEMLQPPTSPALLNQRLHTALTNHDTTTLSTICHELTTAGAPLLAHLLRTHPAVQQPHAPTP